MYTFHGCCGGCTRQAEVGVDRCIECRYFDADWSLPDLNNRPLTEDELKKIEIKARLASPKKRLGPKRGV